MAKVNAKFMDAAMKGLARRPKLIKAISKGTEFHKLKEIGGVSGGFIRKLMKAGIVSKEEGIVSFEKGMEKAVGKVDVDSPSSRPEKAAKKDKKKGRKAAEDDDEEDDEKPRKKSKKSKEEDEEDDDDSDGRPVKKGKTKKELKQEANAQGETLKTAKVKLLRPVKDIPANKALKAEYDGVFWWVDGNRIANQNLTFLNKKE